jgi:hypothetical protein
MKNAADFRTPVHHVSFFILHIEVQLAMRIHQSKFRHSALQRELLIHGVRRAGSMMREDRRCNGENANQ